MSTSNVDFHLLQILSIKQLAELLGVHRCTIWRSVKNGQIPKPLKITKRRVGWRLVDIQQHIQNLVVSK